MKPPQGKKQSQAYDEAGHQNLLAIYLGDIGKFPLLTREQEVELAAKIKTGDNIARDLMINSNLRLVVKIAHDYMNFGLPLTDMISEGNLGLITAVERFDPNKGGKLSTYASWWIKQRIKRALANQSKTIRLPVHLADKLSKIRKTSAKLQEELGRDPTDEEIGKELDTPAHKIAHLKSVSTQPASLDAPVGEEEKTTVGEMIGDENAPTPGENLLAKDMQQDVQRCLNQLEPRQAEVIRLRFGLDGNVPRTLEEIGQKFDITRERIRQLQNIALVQIRRQLADRERQSTTDELEKKSRKKREMEILWEFLQDRTKKSSNDDVHQQAAS